MTPRSHASKKTVAMIGATVAPIAIALGSLATTVAACSSDNPTGSGIATDACRRGASGGPEPGDPQAKADLS
jgi:hypothetical protein